MPKKEEKKRLSNQQILAKVWPLVEAVRGTGFLVYQARTNEHDEWTPALEGMLQSHVPELTSKDFIGKRIVGQRRIKNPAPYNPEFTSPNPEWMYAWLFDDESVVIFEEVGLHDDRQLNCYYSSRHTFKYSANLFPGTVFNIPSKKRSPGSR